MYANSKRKALLAASNAIAAARDKLDRAQLQYPTREPDLALMAAVTGGDPIFGHLAMCNFAVRLAAQDALIEAILGHFRRVCDQPNVRHFLFTACFNDGFCWEDQPEFAQSRLELKVRRALRDSGMHAVCAFETDVLSKRLLGEEARRLMHHVHAICWTDDPGFSPRSAEASLMSGSSFRNNLGANGIRFTSRAESATRWQDFSRKHPERDQIASSMAWLAYYLLKAPHYAKNLVRQPGRRPRLRYDAGAFRLKTALRMAEFWSRLTPFDAVFAVGHGQAVAEDYRCRVRRWESDNRSNATKVDASEIEGLWERLFADHPKLGFLRTQIS